MKKNDLLGFFDMVARDMRATLERKNQDYTGGGDNALRNFLMVEHFGATDAATGFFTRMTDKMARLATFVRHGVLQCKDESVDDTLGDLANYCILFLAYLAWQRSMTAKAPGSPAITFNPRDPP